MISKINHNNTMKINIKPMFFKPIITLILIILIAIIYYFDDKGTYKIKEILPKNAITENFQDAKAGFLTIYPPYAAKLQIGAIIKFADGERRAVVKITGKTGPLWTVWVDGAALSYSLPKKFKVMSDKFPVVDFIACLLIPLTIGLLIHFPFFYLLYSNYYRDKNDISIYSIFAISYFIAIAFILMSWRLISYIAGDAQMALFITLAIALLGQLIIPIRAEKRIYIKYYSIYSNFCIIYVFLSIYFLLYWVAPSPGGLNAADPHVPLGPFEAGRYANISTYIHDRNSIPFLKQNYGQSLLAAISSFFGLAYPRASLIFWLAAAVTAISLLAWGFVADNQQKRGAQIFVTAILLLGGPRLTASVTQVTDNHSAPLLYNAYADTNLSLGALFSVYILMIYYRSNSHLLNWKHSYTLLYLFLLGSLWSICGFQSGGILVFSMIYFLSFHRKSLGAKYLIFAGLAALSGMGALSLLGGPLSFQNVKSPPIPGLIAAPEINLDNISLGAHAPLNWFFDPYHWAYNTLDPSVVFSAVKWMMIRDTLENIEIINYIYFDILKSCFFIIIALFIHHRFRLFDTLFHFVVSTLVGGVAISSLITVGENHWQFLRFMNPAYFFGMLFFGLYGWKILCSKQSKLRPFILACVVIVFLGPTIGIVLQIAGSFDRLGFAEKINLLMSLPPSTAAAK